MTISLAPVIPPEIPRKPEPKKPGVSFVRAEAAVPQHRLHHLEVKRERLPMTDPYRFELYAPDPSFMTDPSWMPGVTL